MRHSNMMSVGRNVNTQVFSWFWYFNLICRNLRACIILWCLM